MSVRGLHRPHGERTRFHVTCAAEPPLGVTSGRPDVLSLLRQAWGLCVPWGLLTCTSLVGSLGYLHSTGEKKKNKHCLLVACSELGREPGRPFAEESGGRGAHTLSAEGTVAEK